MGRVVAALVILVGVAVLVYVFAQAVQLFSSPVPGLGLPVPKGESPPSGMTIGVALAGLLSKLLILTVMIVAGSLIATKGIHLYGTALTHQIYAGQALPGNLTASNDVSNISAVTDATRPVDDAAKK